MKTDWLTLFYEKKFQSFIHNQVARKLSTDIALQEEAISYMIDRLSDDDWAICRKHNGMSSPEAFLRAVSTNLIIEFSRKVFGRKRPPEWLKREGLFWETIWDELCLKRESPEFLIDRYCRNGERDTSSLKNIISTIKAKLPWCGISNRPESIDDDDFNSETQDFGGNSIDDQHEQDTYNQILALVQLVLTEGSVNQASIIGLSQDIRSAVESLQLSIEEKLMLRMHYVDGYSHSAIARKLNVAKHIPVRQNKKTLKKLLELLTRLGIDFEDFS